MNPSRRTSLIWAAVLGAFILGSALPVSASPIVIEKNLFSPDRKPPSPDAEPAAAASSSPAVPPKTLQLDGIFFHGSTRKALVRVKGQMPGKDKSKDTSPFVSVREGDKIHDYVVSKIGTKSIFVEKGGQTFELYLYAAGKVLPPLAPPAPPPAAPGGGAVGALPGDQHGRHGQAQAGTPQGDGIADDAGVVDAGQQPRRGVRGRSTAEARQAMQPPSDEEMLDEMDEAEDLGEE
ncbi:MAG: hypothetical protein MUF52_01575 [Syntrophobacteraceae bacterium]|jgi:hypothetical protein|nr:hypothetical protein [Syntrophobacteraceae bacterium]